MDELRAKMIEELSKYDYFLDSLPPTRKLIVESCVSAYLLGEKECYDQIQQERLRLENA